MKDKSPNDNWREKLYSAEAYTPGEQSYSPGLIKLNTNENPFPPSPIVSNAVRLFDSDSLRVYPTPDAHQLRHAIAEYQHLQPEQVFVGNGSDEVLAFAFKAVFNSDLPVRFPNITYSFYPIWCRFFGIPTEEVPLDDDFRIPAYKFDGPSGGTVISNPNAPTGIGEGPEFIEYILKANPDSVLVVDEAYVDFGGYSSVPLLEKYDNLLISRTMSKSRALAGLRVGYCMGNPEIIRAIDTVKNSFNSYTMNSLTVSAAIAAIGDEEYFHTQIENIMRLRYKYMGIFRSMNFEVLESVANFIFVRNENIDAKELYEYLKSKNILVRHFDKAGIDDFIRITIGTEDEMDVLVEQVLAFMDSGPLCSSQ
jgi:histidinol-phosphate aminotransferase